MRANRLSPDTALPFILFYDSFATAGQPAPKGAIDGLMRAIVLQPAYLDLRVKVGLELISSGQVESAREMLAPVAFSDHLPLDNPLAKLVSEIDIGTRGVALDAKIAELKIRISSLYAQPDPESDKGADGNGKADPGKAPAHALEGLRHARDRIAQDRNMSPELRDIDAEIDKLAKQQG